MWHLRNKETGVVAGNFESTHETIKYVVENNLSWDDYKMIDDIDLSFEKEGTQAIYETYGFEEV